MTRRIDPDRLPEPYRSEYAAAQRARDEALCAIIAALAERQHTSSPPATKAQAWHDAGDITRTIEAADGELDAAAYGQDIAGPVLAYRNALEAEAVAVDLLMLDKPGELRGGDAR